MGAEPLPETAMDRRLALLAVLALPFAPGLGAQSPVPRVAALHWMSGSWIEETERGTVAETWIGPRDGMMAAVNFTTRRSGPPQFEYQRIADTPTGFTYYAQPGGRPAVEFAMKEVGEMRVVFENAAHDFPQRILYWREGEALRARIEGTINGQARQREWTFVRGK